MTKASIQCVEPQTTDQIKKRHMGFWARSTLGVHLMETLDRYKLDVRTNETDGSYHLFSKNEELHPLDILPDYIDHQDKTDKGIIVDLDDLQHALEFMHQPVRSAMCHAASLHHNERINQMLMEVNELGLGSIKDITKESQAASADINNRDHRVTAQSALRFLTTASVDIPIVKADHSDSDECHADEENKMRDKDAWALNYEAGHKDHAILFDVNDPPEDKIKTIPEFYFEPSRGFILNIHPNLLNEGTLEGKQQQALRDELFKFLEIKTSDQVQTQKEIVLTPNKVAEFCNHIHNSQDINNLISAVKLEENAQARNKRIAQGCAALKDDKVFKAATARTGMENADRRIALEHILEVTTALTPIIGGAYTNKLWGEFFPSLCEDSPFDDVISEYTDMKTKIAELLDQDIVTKEELESFAQEYYKTLAFTGLSAESMKRAAEDQNTKSIASYALGIGASAASTGLAYLFTNTGGDTNLLNVIAYGLMARSGFTTLDRALNGVLPNRKDKDQDMRMQIFGQMDNIGNIVQNMSVMGIQVEEEFLEDHHQETLSVMRKALRQDGSFGAQALNAAKESGGEFIDDIKNSFRDSQVTRLATIGTAGYLVYSSLQGDNTPAQIAADALSSAPLNSSLGMGLEDFLSADAVELAQIPRPEEINFSCHTDVKVTLRGAIEAYKHCIFGTLVEDQASNIVSGTDYAIQNKIIEMIANDKVNAFMVDHFGVAINGNENSVFTEAARAAVKPVAGSLMVINFLQNITHAGLWSYSGKKGWDVGFNGYKESFSFINPLLDIGRRAVRAPFTAVSAALSHVGVNVPFLPEPPKSVHDNLYRLLSQSDGMPHIKLFEFRELEDSQSISNDIADISMKLGGFKQKFTLRDENLNAAQNAVDTLDIKLRHVGQKIGVAKPWHQAMLRTHLDGLKNTLNNFENNGDALAFTKGLEKHLGMLSGFELRQTGSAEIFNALTGKDMDERTERVLSREANIAYGREERLAGRAESTMHLIGADDKQASIGSVAWAGVSILGNQAWDKTIIATRNAQRVSNYIGNRPVLNYGIKGGVTALIGADAIGILPENAAAEYLTSTLGTSFGAAATGGSFVIFNSGEDVLLVHTTMMSALITTGAVSAIALKKGIAPSAMASAEALREKWPALDIISGAEAIKEFTRKNVSMIGEKLHAKSLYLTPDLQDSFEDVVSIPQSRYNTTNENDISF